MTTLELTKSKTESELIRDITYEKWDCCNGYHADSDIDMVGGMAIPVCPVTGEIV